MENGRPTGRIAAVVLAAGLSSRMGQSKALLPFGGKPLLVHVIDKLIETREIEPIFVVTGHQPDQIAQILHPFPVHQVHNPAYATGGMYSSVRTGVAAAIGKADALFIVLADQPMVKVQTLQTMARAWREKRPSVLLPTHGGKHGHPIVLSMDDADEILSLTGENVTLKTYTSTQSEHTLELAIDDPAVLADIDTPADYQAALAALQRSRSEQPDHSERSIPCPTED